MEMIKIPGGTFLMGGDVHDHEKPIHRVNVQTFYMGKYAVTNEEYYRFLKEVSGVKEPYYWRNMNFNQPRQPVVGVSWHDAKKFAEWAGGRLPSESEWEYACRAGSTSDYSSGDGLEALKKVGWCNYEGKWGSAGQTKTVGSFEPNSFGLYHMHGNVWEWCEDNWHDNYKGAPEDGSAWVDDKTGVCVVRGGSWSSMPEHCRSAFRNWYAPDFRHYNIGFRVAASS